MRKTAICLFIIMVCLFSTLGVRADGLDHSEVFKSDEVVFEELYTTGYLITGTTATGGTTRPGIAANNFHVGEIAVCYTVDGEYLGQFEVTDTGGSDGMQSGVVLDVWFPSEEDAKEWMRITQGRVMVQWISGNG